MTGRARLLLLEVPSLLRLLGRSIINFNRFFRYKIKGLINYWSFHTAQG